MATNPVVELGGLQRLVGDKAPLSTKQLDFFCKKSYILDLENVNDYDDWWKIHVKVHQYTIHMGASINYVDRILRIVVLVPLGWQVY